MVTLALDTTTRDGDAAPSLRGDDVVLAEVAGRRGALARRRIAAAASMDALAAAGRALADVDVLRRRRRPRIVHRTPRRHRHDAGTGRSPLARPLVGVSALDALAACAAAESDAGAGGWSRTWVDAWRGRGLRRAAIATASRVEPPAVERPAARAGALLAGPHAVHRRRRRGASRR